MSTHITIEGNLTRDPELRFTQSGKPVANFGVADNRRWKDAQGHDQEATSFYDCVAWGELGENLAASLSKGDRVIVVGRLEQRSWTNDDGETRSKLEITADGVGPSLRWATGTVQRTNRREDGEQRPAVAAAPSPAYSDDPF